MQWEQRIGHRLKLRDLQILLAVAKSGSMAKAGTRLAISQPAISKAISAMEHTFGVRLFERSPRGIEPTRYGQALMKRSAAVFDELRQSVKDIEFLSDPTIGEIRIGCTAPLAAGLVTEVIARLSREYPRITFQLVENDPIPLIRELDERNVELVLARMPDGHIPDHMDVEIFYRDTFMVVAGLAQGGAILLTRALMADVVDEDEVTTGARRSGIYFGLLMMTSKAGLAAGPLSYAALQVFGFNANLGEANSAVALGALSAMFIGLPVLLCFLGALSMRHYPLDEKRQAALAAAIAARHSKNSENTLGPSTR